MERLAGLSPAGALLVRSGESLALHFVLADADANPQNLAGATFELLFRRTAYSTPVVAPIAGILSGDLAYVTFPVTPQDATAIYEAGAGKALSYNVVETTGNGQITRFVQRVTVAPGPDVPGESLPVWIDLPVSQLLITPDTVIVSERGARGDGTPALEAAVASDAVRIATEAERLATADEREATEAERLATAQVREETQAIANMVDGRLVAGELARARIENYTDSISTDDGGLALARLSLVGARVKAGQIGAPSSLDGSTVTDYSGLARSRFGPAGPVTAAGRIGAVSSTDGRVVMDGAGLVKSHVTDGGVRTGAGRFGVPCGLDGRLDMDPAGLAAARVGKGGIAWGGGSLALAPAGFDRFDRDSAGLARGFTRRGRHYETFTGTFEPRAPDFTVEEIAQRDALAKASYAAIRRRIPACEPYVYGYNVVGLFGQSLGAGQEAWPVRTRTALSGAYMIGQSERPSSPYTLTYDTIGDGLLHALVGTAQDQAVDFHPANLAEQITWPESQHSGLGETILPGGEAYFRQLLLEKTGQLVDPSRETIVFNSSVPGTTIAELSKGATYNYYARNPAAATKAKALADAAGRSSAMSCWYFMQGEYDENADTSMATYKAALKTLRANLRADVELAIFGQTRTTAFITYQTGAQFMDDDLGPQVGMAQWALSKEEPEWYLAAPSYSVSDKGGHLDSNGSRWLGCQMAKVRYITAVRREGWRPVEPIRHEVRGRTALLTFHVPQPPLQWMAVPVAHVMTSYDLGGFRFTDDAGALDAYHVEIVADCVVAAHFKRDPMGVVQAWYASAATAGHGNLADSDPTLSPFTYDYAPGQDFASANVPELVGKPYPLNNFSIAFRVELSNLN